MASRKIRKGDEVVVLTGKDKGKRGTVLKVLDERIVVENINMAKKHTKANPQAGEPGGILDKESLYCTLPEQAESPLFLTPR